MSGHAESTTLLNIRLLAAIFLLFLTFHSGFGQLQVTCPANIVQVADPNSCGAYVNYSILYNTNLTEDTLISGGPTGSWYYWQVPAGVGEIELELWGAQGNKNALNAGQGGLGGHVTGSLPVTPGEYIYFEIGGGNNTGPYADWFGGGYAGYSPCFDARGGAGGGATSVWQGGFSFYNRVMVAGGGGGAGGNRVMGCGRGTGGGGGGGWFGGGGGAAWPYTSTILPTGGTQFVGGNGGISSYSSNAPFNNGQAGDIYYGGYGGEELQSTQGGSGSGANGGDAGGLNGSGGTYVGNFTGQSGAGGSSYLAPTVLNGSILNPDHAGTGELLLTYPSPVTSTLLFGGNSGDFFPLGVTQVGVRITQGTASDSCIFTVSINETTPPVIYCPATATVSLDANCGYSLQDYRSFPYYLDNCTNYANLTASLQQSPAPGTVLSGLQPDTVWISVTDDFGGQDSCYIQIEKIDGAPPVAICPGPTTFQPTTLDCGPSVNFTPPTFLDNCLGNLNITSNYQPGDMFLVGTTTVNYTATDLAGYSAQCSFTVTVFPPRLDSLVSINLSGPCEGDTVMLVADPGLASSCQCNPSFLWSTVETNDTIYVTQGGDYTLRVRDGFCIATDTFNVALLPAPTPVLIWGPTTPQFCTSQPFQSYQWFRSVHPDSTFILIPGANNQCYQPTQSLFHKVEVGHQNGCVTESNPEIRTSIEETFANPGFLVYPNPAGNQLFVELLSEITSEGKLTILDALGHPVKVQTLEPASSRLEIDLSQLPAGSYFLEMQHDGIVTGRAKISHIR